MFSGIIESVATVAALRKDGGNLHITLFSPIADQLKIDQSIAHNGVCLTVVELGKDSYTVTAIDETLQKSNLGSLKTGDKVNIERSMRPDALLDGHIVQGHVDMTARCVEVREADGSHVCRFEYEPGEGRITVEKGSVAVNGVSLTVVNSRDNGFEVAIIPYTWEHTNFHTFAPGTVVNIEFDIIGKYITKLMKNYR